MANILYFQCFSGISGDMCLGALMDCGVPKDHLDQEIDKLLLKGFYIEVKKINKKGIGCTKATIVQDTYQEFRHLPDILAIISNSSLSPWVKAMSAKAFNRLAKAEASVHQTTIDKIHFHEVGALDAIVDIVGTFVGVEYLQPTAVMSSPLPTGGGYVKCAHGILPVPAPATLELLRGVPLDNSFSEGELVTPTGAAIITTLTDHFGPIPSGVVQRLGYGAGTKEFSHPNLLRIMLIDTSLTYSPPLSLSAGEKVGVLEANVDDMTGEDLGFLMEKIFATGALDIYYTPVLMKKNRPGQVITILFPLEKQHDIVSEFFAHSTSFGLRISHIDRITLRRISERIQLPSLGEVRVKLGYLGDSLVQVSPEYEDCAAIARANNIPLKSVYDFAKRIALNL